MDNEATFEITFIKKDNYFLIRAEGNLTIPDITLNFKKIVSSPEYDVGMNGIWDLSKADLYDLSPESVAALANQMMELAHNKSVSIVAIVSEKSINLGLINLFTEHYEDDSTELKVFDSLKKATEWISQPMTAVNRTLNSN